MQYFDELGHLGNLLRIYHIDAVHFIDSLSDREQKKLRKLMNIDKAKSIEFMIDCIEDRYVIGDPI